MKAKHLRQALITSAIALVVCIAMLAGSTYAWFTDSVTSTGNVIKAGTLDVEAYYYDYNSSGTKIKAADSSESNDYVLVFSSGTYDNVYLSGSQTLSFDLDNGAKTLNGAQMITDSNVEPGWSSAKLIQVVNKGTLAAKVKINYAATGDLEDALWFDFVKVEKGSNGYYATGTFTPRAMSTLYDFAKSTEISLAGTTSGTDYKEVYFMLVYGMYTNAGNEYQGEEINIDVAVVATQDTSESEKDGFGSSSYDASAEYPAAVLQSVSTSAGVVDALEEGNVAVLTEDVTVSAYSDSELYTLLNSTSGDVDAVIDVSADDATLTLATDSGYSTLNITNGNSLTIIGSGNSSDAELVATNQVSANANISVASGSSVTLNGVNVSATGSVLFPFGDAAEVNVINSTITTTGAYVVGTNSQNFGNYGVEINIENSTITANANDYDSCAVMTNVASNLNISNSYIYGQRQGVVVRAGTAKITNTVISCKLDTYYAGTNFSTMQSRTTGTWGGGNEVAMGAVVVGNVKGNTTGSYTAEANLTISGCTLSYDIYTNGVNVDTYSEYEIGLYMITDSSNGKNTVVSVSDCTINDKVIALQSGSSTLTYTGLDSYTVYTTWANDAWTTGS